MERCMETDVEATQIATVYRYGFFFCRRQNTKSLLAEIATGLHARFGNASVNGPIGLVVHE